MTTIFYARPRPGLGTLFFVTLLFLATGAAGLIYQVVWQRYLLNVFGATIYSVSTVLSAFMAGLALGSFLFGSRAARMKSHLWVYGVIEILIGASALAVPFLLQILDPLLQVAYDEYGSQFFLFSVIRFVIVFGVLLIPTTLMGATLPILAQFLSPTGAAGPGLRVGLLYAVNTTGAVVGAVLSGFYLIRWIGVQNTVYVAAAINFAAGVLAILLNRSFNAVGRLDRGAIIEELPADVEPAPEEVQSALKPGWIYTAYFISGLAALGLEVTWSRSLVFTFESLKNTTYAFTAMLATFLVGIAAGSALMTPFANRLRHPVRQFAILQIIVGLFSIFSFFVLYYIAYNLGDQWIREFDNQPGQIRWNAAVALVFLRTAAVMFLPTFFMGLAFPVAVRAITWGVADVGRRIGKLYALNTLGAIVGAALTGFLLLPGLGIAKTIYLLGSIQMIAGVAIILQDPDSTKARKIVWSTVAGLTLLIGFLRIPQPAVFQQLTTTERMAYYKEGPLATVSVVENSLGYRTIYVDNVGVAGTDPMLLTDQKSLAHVPMLLLKEPRSALTVGFGSGGASYSYTLYPELEKIHCVEITKTVPEAAPYLKASNHGIIDRIGPPQAAIAAPATLDAPTTGIPLWNEEEARWIKKDPRFDIILDDARSYLRFTQQRYDIIATDCTDLRYKSNANLYDLEYFQLCKERLTPDGMVVVWMPLAGLSPEAMKVALRTFYVVFPQMEVFFMNNQPTHYVLLIGKHGPLQVDVDTMRQRLARPEVAKDLGEIYLADAEKLLSCFILGRDQMKAYLGEGNTLNTEINPYLEFESPRYGYSDEPLLNNLDELLRYRENPARLVSEPEKHPEFLKSLQKYFEAVPHIIDGHRHYRELRLLESAAAYMKALQVNPADRSVKDLLDFDELRRKVKGQRNQWWAYWVLGEVMAMQDRHEEAVTVWNEMLQQPLPADPQEAAVAQQFVRAALDGLADVYGETGDLQKATEYRRRAASIPVLPQPGS